MASSEGDMGRVPDGFSKAIFEEGKQNSATIIRAAIRTGASKEMALQLGKDFMDIATEVNQAFFVGTMTEPEALDRLRDECLRYIASFRVQQQPDPNSPQTEHDAETFPSPSRDDSAKPTPPKRPRSEQPPVLEETSSP